MNKILKKYSVVAFILVGFWSCGVDETESLFDETPTERIESRKDELRKLLLSQPEGFSAVYYTNEDSNKGYNLHIKFNQDLTLEISSDVTANTEVKIAKYDVVFGHTAELVFTTNNGHQTALVTDPDGDGGSEGASNSFEYHSNNNGIISLFDIRNSGILELRPSGFEDFRSESVASADFTYAARPILEGTSFEQDSRNIFLDGDVIGQFSYDSATRVATIAYTDASGAEQREEVRMYITTTGITFFVPTSINGTATSINGTDLLVFTYNEASEQYIADDNSNLIIDDLETCPFDASAINGVYNVSEMFVGGTNGGLQLGSFFGESYQVDIAFDPADPSRILVTNSPGFNNFIIDGNQSTPTVFLLDLATLELSYEAGGPRIALFRFLSGASLSFDICSDLVSFTSNGLLGQFGFYEFIFTKQ